MQILALANPWLEAATSIRDVANQTQWNSWNLRQLEFACKLYEVTQGTELTEALLVGSLDFLEGRTADRLVHCEDDG
jgi:hypothetical protein